MINMIWQVKNSLEQNYSKFKKHHQILLNLLEDADYVTDSNQENFISILEDYEKDMDLFDEVFNLFDRHERQIKILIQDDVGVLKKKRQELLTRISSQMESRKESRNNDYDDLPF